MHTEQASAIIIPFPVPVPQPNRLTRRERSDIAALARLTTERGLGRLEVHEDTDPEIGDCLALYRPGEPWAAWGIARRGDGFHAWRSATGRDLGRFKSIALAVEAVLLIEQTEAPGEAIRTG